MAGKGSQSDHDGVVWQSVGLRLGLEGLDLREPAEPTSLTRLLNARFSDERSIRQRSGHRGVLVHDDGGLQALGNSYAVEGEWVFGHGERVSSTNAAGWENAHHPFPNRAEAVLHYNGADLVWTGDRLVVARAEGAALGAHTFWQRGASSTPLKWGIPAYLPLMTDTTPPTAVDPGGFSFGTGSNQGSYVETCLTPTVRAVVHASSAGTLLTAHIIDRETNAVIDTSEISGVSNDIANPKVIRSGDFVVVLWRDGTSNVLYRNHWNGFQWSGVTVIQADVLAFDVVPVESGFYLLYRIGAPSTPSVCIGKFSGVSVQNTPFIFGTDVSTDLVADVADPDGVVALDVAPDGGVGLLVEADGLQFRALTASLSPLCDWTTADNNSGFTGGVSIRARGLKNPNGTYPWVIHCSRGADNGVRFLEVVVDESDETASFHTGIRFNSTLASRSFRAGDEVFCWIRSSCAGTHYLVAGAPEPQVVGYADREEALLWQSDDGNYGASHVFADPLDERGLTFSWARPFNSGEEFSHRGNTRIGDIDVLPTMTWCQYGQSLYLSGSAVRNWDGVELGDAGFHDYPVIASTAQDTGGDLEVTGKYFYVVYAVRYNARGERFKSAGLVSSLVELVDANDKVTLTIKTMPSTNHDDVVFEVYRTKNLGTAFYLIGTVDNDLTAATVTFEDTTADDDLDDNTADPVRAGVGQAGEIEEFGPLGCSVLAVAGDRLWGIGGQVPPGSAQFSKLKEPGEGAGFDVLGGFQTVDNEGGVLTSVHGSNDAVVIHQPAKLYVLAGTGPDNQGRGGYTIPQIALADGAVTHVGADTQLGRVYWGKDGPRLLSTSFQVSNISAPIRSLVAPLDPSGCIARMSEHEVVWYTRSGTALLWCYLGGASRWAQWTGLKIAGAHDTALVTTAGVLLYEDEDAAGDNGSTFPFLWCTGNLRGEDALGGSTHLRSVGVVGRFEGPHRLRFRVFYNGSPMWVDEWIWDPTDNTGLMSGDDLADLTTAELDALDLSGRAGGYSTHKRVSRPGCQFFRVEVSNIECDGPTYVPYELTLELGAMPGLGRVPVNTFTGSVAR